MGIRRVFAVLAVAVAALSISTAPAVSSDPTANLWIDQDGGTCTHQSPAGAYSDAGACSSLQAAADEATTNDTILVKDGTYPGQQLTGTKTLTFKGAGPGRPSFGQLFVSASNVTFEHLLVENRDRPTWSICSYWDYTLYSCGADQTYDDVIVDGLEKGKADGDENRLGGVEVEDSSTNFTFRNGEIRGIRDNKGFQGGADGMVIDHNIFHDVGLTAAGAAADVHLECAAVTGGDNQVWSRNQFYDCSTINWVAQNYVGGPAFGPVTLENNVFAHPILGDDPDTWQQGAPCLTIVGGNNGTNSVEDWVVRYNTFECAPVIGTPSTADDDGSALWYGNLGADPGCSAPEWTISYNVGDVCSSSTGNVVVANALNTSSAQDQAPFYVDAPNHDFHLKTGSNAAVDFGANTGPSTDLDGNARDALPDAGAYESPPAPQGNLWVDSDGGTCTRSSAPAAYSDADACSLSDAYDAAESADTIAIKAGTYGDWSTPSGTKTVTFVGGDEPMPAIGFTSIHFSNATFRHVEFSGVDTEGGAPENLTFENFVIDGGGLDDHGALSGGDGGNHTFLHGSIGNVTNQVGVQYSGEGHLLDDVVFHDVVDTGDVLHMCFHAIGTPGMTIRNSTFVNCAQMDLFFNYGSWWDPLPDPYGGVTLENNVFGHPRFANGSDWHYYSLVIGNTGDSNLEGWTVRNNTFENTADISASTATDSRWVGNLGDWTCVSGMTYRHNVGWDCGGTGDTSESPASSGGPPSYGSVFYADFDWADPANNNFHLLETSPAIGEADPADAPATDRDGNPRDSAPDAGAYEYVPAP